MRLIQIHKDDLAQLAYKYSTYGTRLFSCFNYAINENKKCLKTFWSKTPNLSLLIMIYSGQKIKGGSIVSLFLLCVDRQNAININ